MNHKGLMLAFLALTFAASAYPDAFKCKTADGKTVISSTPCQSGSKTEAVLPSDEVSPEQRRRAEQALERDQKLLAEREAARAVEQQREQDSRRKLAEEESFRQTQCLQNAQREPDPQIRASLIAACTGAPPPQPIVVQQPVYFPLAPIPSRPVSGSARDCVGSDCKATRMPAQPKPQPTPTSHSGKVLCRQVGNSVRCGE